jgi:hypothetical protein
MAERTGKLNIQKNIFLESEEVNKLQNFFLNSVPMFLFENSTEEYGIIANPSLSGNDFLIEAGTNVGTVKMNYESYAIDSQMRLMYGKVFDNFPVPAKDQWYWLKLSYREYRLEEGTIDISADGSVSGTSTNFKSLLRGQIYKQPTKIRIMSESSNGTVTSSTNNSGVYEVVSVSDDENMVLSGSFTAENNMKYIVVGAYTLGTTLDANQKSGLYIYDWAEYEMVAEINEDEAPTSPSGTKNEDYFWLARVWWDSSTDIVTVQDKRDSDNGYWKLDFGEIILNLDDKADTDAGNLTSDNFKGFLSGLNKFRTTTITDADNLTTPGNYIVNSDYLNIPLNEDGYIEVYVDNSSGDIYQKYIGSISSGDELIIYTRKYVNGTTSWGNWICISTPSYINLNGNIDFSDFDNLTSPTKVYVTNPDSASNNPSNKPGFLIVDKREDSSVVLYQTYQVISSDTEPEILIRQHNGISWGSWRQVYPVKQATESSIGGGKIAPQSDVDEGTDDTLITTPAKLHKRGLFAEVADYGSLSTSEETILDLTVDRDMPNALICGNAAIRLILNDTNSTTNFVEASIKFRIIRSGAAIESIDWGQLIYSRTSAKTTNGNRVLIDYRNIASQIHVRDLEASDKIEIRAKLVNGSFATIENARIAVK